MIKGYACRSKNSDSITIAISVKPFKTPDMKKETGWFWHIPGWFYTMKIRSFKRMFGFSIKPGTYKLVNILVTEQK